MKTSSIFVGIAIIGGIATLAAADFKIKSEYTKGNIQSAYNKVKLPAFKYIRENVDSTIANPVTRFEVIAGKGQESSAGSYFVRPAPLTFKVSHDTLYITSELLEKNGNYTHEPFLITTPSLESVESTRGLYKINHENADALSLTARKTSQIALSAGNLNRLSLDASEKAGFNISSRSPIEAMEARITQQGSLTLNNVQIRKKTVQFDSTITLTLQKSSVSDFWKQ